MKTDIGIYIHIPFCLSKCGYCNFYSRVADKSDKDNYISKLSAEIKASEKLSARTIYIGGGTPSVLSSENFEMLFESLSEITEISAVEEFTVEMNPESVSEELLSVLKNGGVNRISLGVQSLSDKELSCCNRAHNAEEALFAIKTIKASGFDNISVDVILGLPGQTKKTLEDTLSQLIKAGPSHISAYMLKIEKDTPFYKKGIEERDDDEISDLYLYMSQYLTEKGYEHYEISNFALPEKRAKHNLSYWLGKEYRAFGASAYGYEDGIRYHYPSDFSDFSEKQIDEILSESAKREEYFLLRLRLSDGILLSEMNEKMKEFAKKLEEGGFGNHTETHFALNPKGFLLSNRIISEFIDMI